MINGSSGLNRELTTLEDMLANRCLDFTSAYMAVRDLHSLVKSHPWAVRAETVSALRKIIGSTEYSYQKQSLFFYREAADTLISIGTSDSVEQDVAGLAITALKLSLYATKGNQKRAVAESMGSLPLLIMGPSVDAGLPDEIPSISWEELTKREGIFSTATPKVAGRSLYASLAETDRLLVIKLGSIDGSLAEMQKEILWMDHMNSKPYYALDVRFDVPRPLKVNNKCLFRLKSLPERINGALKIHPELFAIGFIAPKDYFDYLNASREESGLCIMRFKEALFRNAWLLAKLAAAGIIHTAPIPLFHNRVQRNRRSDLGIYEWPRGGRLDRWLHSCRYPNFGPSGLRDFEHFVSCNGHVSKLYQHIGTHILSLLLVAASYFRYQDPQRIGFDPQGKPVDARDLFDRKSFSEIIQGVILNYYRGFAGTNTTFVMPFDCQELTTRMIDEMGVDRHMEEILRALDQKQMTDKEFNDFLVSRGYLPEAIVRVRKGMEDVIILTGPHLGAFNNRISLPELTELLASVSALCIAGKYLNGAGDGKAE